MLVFCTNPICRLLLPANWGLGASHQEMSPIITISYYESFPHHLFSIFPMGIARRYTKRNKRTGRYSRKMSSSSGRTTAWRKGKYHKPSVKRIFSKLKRGRGPLMGGVRRPRMSKFAGRVTKIVRGTKPPKCQPQAYMSGELNPARAQYDYTANASYNSNSFTGLQFNPRFQVSQGSNSTTNGNNDLTVSSDNVFIKGIKVHLTVNRNDITTTDYRTQAFRFQINQTIGNTGNSVDDEILSQFWVPDPTSDDGYVPPTPIGNDAYETAVCIPRNKELDHKYNRVLDTQWKPYKAVQRGNPQPFDIDGDISLGAPIYEYPMKHWSWWIPINRGFVINANGTIDGWRTWNNAIFGTWDTTGNAPDFSICYSMYYCDGE